MDTDKVAIKEKNYLFLILANVLSILFLLIVLASIWAESQPMAQGGSAVMLVFSFPVLIGGSFLMMIIAKIRDEKPLWAYISVIILPALYVLIFTGSEKQDLVSALLFLTIVTGAGAVSYGIGCFIKKYFIKVKDPVRRIQNEDYSVRYGSKSRFVIKSAKFISVTNCFLTLMLLNVEFGDVVISFLGILTIISLILLLVSKLKLEHPSFIDFVIANASLFTSLFVSAYFSEWLMFWILILILFFIEPVTWRIPNRFFKTLNIIIFLILAISAITFIVQLFGSDIIRYFESSDQSELNGGKKQLEFVCSLIL